MASQNNDNKTVPFLSEPEAEMSANHDIPEVWATAELTAVELPFFLKRKGEMISSVAFLSSFLSVFSFRTTTTFCICQRICEYPKTFTNAWRR